jgi:hypothetical protein
VGVHCRGGSTGRSDELGGAVNAKAFFVDALGSALELGVGTPDDVLRHVTPDVLAAHLPRPLWARLFTACLGAPKVDAQLVIETIGIANLCEHVPTSIIWSCIAEIGARSLGLSYSPPPVLTRASLATPSASAPTRPTPPPMSSVLAPPPAASEAAVPVATTRSDSKPLPAVNEPLADLITELEADDRPITPTRARTPTAQRFRQSNTGIGRLGASNQQRRPMASAPPPAASSSSKPRRTGTEVEEVETEAGGGEWKSREIAVDDSQLVDWQAAETTQASDDDFSDIGRKR